MADRSHGNLSLVGGNGIDDTSSFNTASDSSQEEMVSTVKKKEKSAIKEESCNGSEQGSDNSNGEKQSSRNENDSRASVNSYDSINTENGSKSIGDISKKSEANDSRGSRGNDSKGSGKGIEQRLHQGTAASRAKQGKKVI